MKGNQTRIPDPMRHMSDSLLARLSSHVSAHMGLNFPRAKWQTLEIAFSSAARELGFQDPQECATWFITTPLTKEMVESMAGYLTIGETYFLRENRSFEILAQVIIPEIIRMRRGGVQRLRIWSAGCATGEEPYSIAIRLDRMCDTLRDWKISILATDINSKALRKAEEGSYTEWSFRNTPSWLKEKYFIECGDGRLQMISPIKEMVHFSYLNLVEDLYPSLPRDTDAMDVIFCRNVLMYFTDEQATKVVECFHRSLVEGGWLIVSPCETSQVHLPQFKAVNFGDAIFYRKPSPGTEKLQTGGSEPKIHHTQFPELAPLPAKPPSGPPLPFSAFRPPTAGRKTDYEEAVALYDRGLYPEAEKTLATFLSSNQENAKATVLLCRIRANQGKLAEARRLLEKVMATDKLNPGLYYLLAMILQEQGANKEASVSLKRALYLDQNLVLAHIALANLALKQGRVEEYRKYLENALSILGGYESDEILPESEGMTVGRLKKLIGSMDVMGERDEK